MLAYKKGDPNEPENFRPITQQSVSSKIFASVIWNKLYQFVGKNEYIESNLQKGFWEKISGCVEHIETLTHIIKNAWLKQKDCVITLLDLKNAFGEVNHHLLTEALKLHHIPDDVITLTSSLYSDYDISILTDSFMTSPIRVHRSVLQGDSLSPLLFNLIINTPINAIKSEKIECIRYFYQNCLRPKHWFQFADDAAIVTALESDNQHLCNVFLKRTFWLI